MASPSLNQAITLINYGHFTYTTSVMVHKERGEMPVECTKSFSRKAALVHLLSLYSAFRVSGALRARSYIGNKIGMI